MIEHASQRSIGLTCRTMCWHQRTTRVREPCGFKSITIAKLADGKEQRFTYDRQQIGTLAELQDASGSTQYERDPFGRITKKTQTVLDNPAAPSILITQYAYTAAGDLSQISYPSGLIVYYRRSASGQITSIDTQRPKTNAASATRTPPTTALITNITHTALNQPKSWSYNCITGNLYTPAISLNCTNASRSFDQDGRMTSNEFASYTYDAASRITGITQSLYAERNAGNTNSNSNSNSNTSANGKTLTLVPFTWSASYDQRHRLVSFNRPGSEQSYQYDANSNRLSSFSRLLSSADFESPASEEESFSEKATLRSQRQTQSIPANSNRLLGFTQSLLTQSISSSTLTTATLPLTSAPSRTLSNVLTNIAYTLDANGNLASDGLRSFQYDSANRLSEVDAAHNGEAAKIIYLHNALGQRSFKSEPQSAQTLPGKARLGESFTDWLEETLGWLFADSEQNRANQARQALLGRLYSYGEGALPSWALLGEYGNGASSNSSETANTEYIWLPVNGGNAIPIAMLRANRYYSIHSDHLGTPRLIKDDEAKPVWQWSYSAFGDNAPIGLLKAVGNSGNGQSNGQSNPQTQYKANSPAIAFNLRFPGQYADSETGLFYNYFRSYQATQGRYTQVDPIGLNGGMNRFAYANANALSYSDPNGLCPNPIICAIPSWTGGAYGGAAGAAVTPAMPAPIPVSVSLPLPQIAPLAVGAIGIFINAINSIISNLINSSSDATSNSCTPNGGDPCKQLNDEVQAAKDRAGQLGRCEPGMSYFELSQRYAAWLNLATARAKRDQKCWNGGDVGHQQAQADAWLNVGRCSGLLK